VEDQSLKLQTLRMHEENWEDKDLYNALGQM